MRTAHGIKMFHNINNGVKYGAWTDHSVSYSAGFKYAWSHISTPLYIFMVWSL